MDTNHRNSKRPKPNMLIQYDPNNFYAKLGVSPQASIRDIKSIITKKQNEAKNKKRYEEAGKYGKAEDEFIEWQKIAKAFASPKKREEYDLLNPQSELLTVQASEYDDWLDRFSRIDLVSAWLVEYLGQEKFLPTPDSLHLWCPCGIDTELLSFLEQFEIQTGTGSPVEISAMEQNLSVSQLEAIAGNESEQTNTSNKNEINNKLKKGE